MSTESQGASLPGRGEEPVAVFVHVHYRDVWEEMAALVGERLTIPFKLVLTGSVPDSDLVRPDTSFLVGTTVIATENRGRDIRPFLVAYAATEGYSIGLKLHTKRSTHRLDGEGWREAILASLLPPDGDTAVLFDALRADPRIGLVAPESSFLAVEPWIRRNMRPIRAVAAVTGLDIRRRALSEARFAAGSMFWFRREALRGLDDERLPHMFAPERGQVDGTTAHAIERLFAVTAARNGMLAMPANVLPAFRPEMGEEALPGLIERMPGKRNPYLRTPYRLIRFVDRYVPATKSVYLALPTGLRRILRGVLARD